MADQKPAPRYRFPSWLAPPPSSAPRPTPANRSSNQPAMNSRPNSKALPKTQPTNTSLPTTLPARPTAGILTPNQATTTTMPASTAAQRPAFRPPGRATQVSSPQPQASKPDSHSSSPARAATQPRVGQPATPPRAANQPQANPHPSTPLSAASQSKNTSLPSSPVHAAPQLPSAAKNASEPQSQSIKATELQLTNEVTHSSSPRKPSGSATQDSPQLPSTSIEAPSSLFDKKEPVPAANSNGQTPRETNIQPNETSQSYETSIPSSPVRAALQIPSTSKTALEPQSQSINATELQLTNEVTQSSSSSKPLGSVTQDSSQLPSTSIEAPSYVFDEKESVPAANSNGQTPNETNIQPNETSQSNETSISSMPVHGAPRIPSTPKAALEHQSQSIKATELQLTNEVMQSSYPSKPLGSATKDSSQLPSTSIEAPSSVIDKKESVPAANSNGQAPSGTNIPPNEKARQSEERGLGATNKSTDIRSPEPLKPTKTLYSPRKIHELKSIAESDTKPEETKEVREIVQETKGEYEEKKQEVIELQSLALDSREEIKERQHAAVKSEHMQKEKQEAIGRRNPLATNVSNGKQNKATTPQPRNKNMVGDSHQQPATFKGEDIPLHKEMTDDISKFICKRTVKDRRYSKDERPVCVITLAGENKGASMQLGSESSNKEERLYIHRRYKLNTDERTEETTDGEGASKHKKSTNQKIIEDEARKTYINSNVQGINNSVLFNGSTTEESPGVYLVQTRTLIEPNKSADRKGALETHKAEYNMTPAEKLTYEPTIRRRCLRGLLLESSDSDPDNPEKPWRHGCRVRCSENKIDIL